MTLKECAEIAKALSHSYYLIPKKIAWLGVGGFAVFLALTFGGSWVAAVQAAQEQLQPVQARNMELSDELQRADSAWRERSTASEKELTATMNEAARLARVCADAYRATGEVLQQGGARPSQVHKIQQSVNAMNMISQQLQQLAQSEQVLGRLPGSLEDAALVRCCASLLFEEG